MGRAKYQEYLASREWALKREAVRRRSGGICERCWTNSMDAVHHKTYERIYREDMDDLQAICNPCHAFLSGKSDFDPFAPIVYFAGKIKKNNDWRYRINSMLSKPIQNADVGENVPGKCFVYGGPWFVGAHTNQNQSHDFAGNQAYSKDAHGLAADCYCGHGDEEIGQYERDRVFDICKDAIERADMVFAYIQSIDAVGTFIELGYAHGRPIPVFVCCSDKKTARECWFAAQSSTHRFASIADYKASWVGVFRIALASWRERKQREALRAIRGHRYALQD